MAGQPTNNAAPEGVDILRSDKDGRIFVINEVLNYYQRKLNVLGFTDAKMLAHHVFNHEKVFEARKALNSLWLWLDLEPIPAHAKVVKNIAARRNRSSKSNYRLVMDILEFLQVEDCRMNVTFLTLQCEDIPSQVTEQEAIKDMLVLLEKNDYKYDRVIMALEEKQTTFDMQANLLQTVKREIFSEFN